MRWKMLVEKAVILAPGRATPERLGLPPIESLDRERFSSGSSLDVELVLISIWTSSSSSESLSRIR